MTSPVLCPTCPRLGTISPRTCSSSSTRVVRDRANVLSHFWRISRSISIRWDGRVERDEAPDGRPPGAVSRLRRRRSRQRRCRARSARRYLSRAAWRRRAASWRLRLTRHPQQQVFWVLTAEGCGRNQLRHAVQRRRFLFLVSIVPSWTINTTQLKAVRSMLTKSRQDHTTKLEAAYSTACPHQRHAPASCHARAAAPPNRRRRAAPKRSNWLTKPPRSGTQLDRR